MSQLQNILRTFAIDLRHAFTDLAVVVAVILFFQFVVLRAVPEGLGFMALGLFIVALGLALFMRGLKIGVFPLGEDLAEKLSKHKNRVWVVLFAFVIGFATTIAEPALIAIAYKAALISNGQIDATTLRLVVAFSVGLAIVLGVVRIIKNHPIHWYIISGYVLVMVVTYFAPVEIVGLAYDSGGVTTSTVTVPLIAALGIGIASVLKGRNPIIDGFGLIALASLTPMIFVQLYGIFAYSFREAAGAIASVSSEVVHGASLFQSAMDVMPVILTILFFYFAVLHKKIPELRKRALGFGLVILGLYAFVVGLELGLFPIGETIAVELTKQGNVWFIYLFALTIGFATTLAEPALTAIAQKAEEISGGSIHATILRLFVAVGVGSGILLGVYRIVNGDSIVLYVLVGYLAVVVLTYLAPKTIVPIAYDSGGVTTSTITVPIVAALGLGVASLIPGRDPLIDGFGLIAFASLFPILTVLLYGIYKQETIRMYERWVEEMKNSTKGRVLSRLISHHEKANAEETNFPQRRIITISGAIGSGVSSAARGVADKLDYRHFSSGELFREIAIENNLSLDAMNLSAEDSKYVDSEIDHLIRTLGEHERIVMDTRLGYMWLPNSFKVYLKLNLKTASSRVYKQIKKGERRAEYMETKKDVYVAMRARVEEERKRFQDKYGIDISNINSFDLTINTADVSLEKVVEIIKTEYKNWLRKEI